jgi:hypothetical protein
MHPKYLADAGELYEKDVGVSLRSVERQDRRRSMRDEKIKLQEL